jgi:hypothetical protein
MTDFFYSEECANRTLRRLFLGPIVFIGTRSETVYKTEHLL